METAPHTNPRQCNKCSTVLVLGDNWTEASKRHNTYWCRDCNAAKGRDFYARNKQHVIDTAKARRHRDPERNREYKRRWYAEHPGKGAEYTRQCYSRVYTDIERRARKMARTCQANSRLRGIEFDIPVEWFAERLKYGYCEVTGLPFDLTLLDRVERGSRTPAFAPSIDRIERGGPYKVGNVRLVVFIFNVARSDFRDEDLETLAKALLAKV